MREKNEPIHIICEVCGNEWDYTGKRPNNPEISFRVICNLCGKAVKICRAGA